MTGKIVVHPTDPKLRAAIPSTPPFRAYHKSAEGVNFMEYGNDKNTVVTKVANLANQHGYNWTEVVEEDL